EAGISIREIDGIAYTEGPGLAGALLVGASVATALGFALGKPVLGVHHLEGHLLSPLLSDPKPAFPFVALLVSGGHSQLFAVAGVGDYTLLGDTHDDAAGEAFDKTAKLLGLPYPGGPALIRKTQKLGGFVERFACGIVMSVAEQGVVADPGNRKQLAVSSRDQQRHEREGGLRIAQQRRKQMPFEMVHSKHGLAECKTQRRGDARAHQKRAGKSGALGVGDPVDLAN